MKHLGTVRFPNSVQLFKFCQRVLTEQRGSKSKDQELGQVLDFNPSDCSHWKRGDKNVKSVFVLAKLAKFLNVEETLLFDIVNGVIGAEEAYFEYQESKEISNIIAVRNSLDASQLQERKQKIEAFVKAIHEQLSFRTPPLFLPELVRVFSFINLQPVEMVDKISRVLKNKNKSYVVQYQRGEFRPQTRMSVVKDIAKIVLLGERERYPEFGSYDKDLIKTEILMFVTAMLAPKELLVEEMSKVDLNKNFISELATAFWVPKSLVSYQVQDIIRSGYTLVETRPVEKEAVSLNY